MLLKILGWFWLLSGILFFLKPVWLRNKLKKRSLKTIRRLIFALAFAVGILLVNATWGLPGWLPKGVFIIGIIAILKAVFFLKAQSAARVVEWFLSRPVRYFRFFAVGQIVFGALVLTI